MGERQKILVMDDRADPLYAAQRRLERAGHEVIGVQTYWSAVSTLLQHHLQGDDFDAAFLDLDAGEPNPEEREYMSDDIKQLLNGFTPAPGTFSGIEVMPALHHALHNERDEHNLPKLPRLKAIWWTGHSGNKEYESLAMHQGVVDYVDKTESPVEIMDRNTRNYPRHAQGHIYIIPGVTGVGKTELERMLELILGKENIQMYRRIGNRDDRQEFVKDTIPMSFENTDEMARLKRKREIVLWESYGKDYFIPVTESGATLALQEIVRQHRNDLGELSNELNKVAANTLSTRPFHSLQYLVEQGVDVMVAFGNARAARECMLKLAHHNIPHSTYLLELGNKHEHIRRLLMKYSLPERVKYELPLDAQVFFKTGPEADQLKRKTLRDAGFYKMTAPRDDPEAARRERKERRAIERRLLDLAAMEEDMQWLKTHGVDKIFDTERFYKLKNSIVENIMASSQERRVA